MSLVIHTAQHHGEAPWAVGESACSVWNAMWCSGPTCFNCTVWFNWGKRCEGKCVPEWVRVERLDSVKSKSIWTVCHFLFWLCSPAHWILKTSMKLKHKWTTFQLFSPPSVSLWYYYWPCCHKPRNPDLCINESTGFVVPVIRGYTSNFDTTPTDTITLILPWFLSLSLSAFFVSSISGVLFLLRRESSFV